MEHFCKEQGGVGNQEKFGREQVYGLPIIFDKGGGNSANLGENIG